LFFYGCKPPSTIEGPELSQLYGQFGISSPLKLSTSTADFATGSTVVFSLGLTKINDWNITITGLNTGAKKILSGKSSTLDVTNAVWNGSTTFFPVFGVEKCAIQISFPGQTLVLYDTIRAVSKKVKDMGTVVANFSPSDLGKLWPTYIDYSIDGDSFSIDAKYHPNLGTDELYFSGVDKNSDTYIGSIIYPCKIFFPSDTTYAVTSNDPSSVYFNVAVLGLGVAGSNMLFQFFEDCNNDGKYTAAADNQYQYPVNVNWIGWQMVSFKYSATTIGHQGNPNKPQNPQKILQVGFVHLATAGQASRLALDYPIFTVNNPFQP
jgi:hypothetical protein